MAGLSLSVPGKTSADEINFEQFTGPTTFAAAGNAQTLSILTSIGTVTVSGGVILTNATNLPADETSIYGTAGNASNIGVSVGTGFTNPLVVTFPVPITNFFLDVLNGNVIPVTYQLSDNMGNSASFDLAPNLSGGQKTVGFAATGTVVDISATTGQATPTGMTWDFFIDNIHFDEPLPTSAPEPNVLLMLGLGLGGAILTAKFLALSRR
jgi:hypothetical protein